MKNYGVCLLISIFLINAEFSEAQETKATAGNDIIRVNLSALAFRNISVEYERKLGERNSLTLNIHAIPFGSLPYVSLAQNLIDKAYVDLNLAKIGSVGATATYRFYSRKKGTFRGFYFAPMVNFNSYKTSLPIQYNNGKTGLFDGNITAITGGLQAGIQIPFGKHIYLDLWLLGPSYGISNGHLNFTGNLSINEQAILSAEIEDLKNSLPIYVISSYNVNSSGATITEQGPWAGLRALGINLGFRF